MMRRSERDAEARGTRWERFASLLLGVTLLAVVGLLCGVCSPKVAAAEGMGACLDCHDEEGLDKSLASGESMNLTISGDEVQSSAHRGQGCRGCHPDVDLDDHPGDRVIASLRAYRTEASKRCLGCHPAERLRRTARHAAVVFEDQRLTCVECHGSHSVQKIGPWKAAIEIDDYCLHCHSQAISTTLPGGGMMGLQIDRGRLQESIHSDHSCPDCHESFSKDAHPDGIGGDRSRRSVAAAQICAACHADKMRQMEGSIHYALLRAGKVGAPGCTDCHGAHDVGPRERYATITGMPCRRCHEGVFEAYAGSRHGEARTSGSHLDAPLCSNCHQAHEVAGAAASVEDVRAACLGCHTETADRHAAWLPNARLHLEMVSCAACHAPVAQRVIALRFVDDETGRAFNDRELTDLLGKDYARIKNPGEKGLDGPELWAILRTIRRNRSTNSGARIAGRLEISGGLDAHRLAGKGEAVRRCDTCHRAGSAFFSQVAVKITGDQGRETRYPAAPDVLTSADSMLPIRQFYALGGTRMGLLDYLLILAVLGGMTVPALHITLRLWASRVKNQGEKS